MTDRPVLVLDERNEPAEQLEALAKQLPHLVTGLVVVPQSVSDLIDAAKERELEIILARRAAEIGCVVTASGETVPREEAARVGDKWVRIPAVLSSSHSRRDRVLSSILSMAVMAGAMPMGLGIPSPYAVTQPEWVGTRSTERLPPSAAVVANRKLKRARRRSRKGRK